VLAAKNLLLTTRVAEIMNHDLYGILDAQSSDVGDVFLGSLALPGVQRTETELAAIRESVRRRIEANINYAALIPTSAAAPQPATRHGGATHHTVFNLSGTNSRVNIGSDDSSTSIVNITPPELFKELREALQVQVADVQERERILTRLGELEREQRTPSAFQRYVDFVAATANHATVIGPYLPARAQLIHPG
jgi:hypothetical protein